jgi:uncharacterized protein YndB with AHSA1/START domain
MRITTAVQIDAPPDRVWPLLADLGGHGQWMADVRSIEFETAKLSGLGTRMRIHTQVGPLFTQDRVEVTAWEEGRRIAIAHLGAVQGTGEFLLEGDDQRSRFVWAEELHFPWYLGGPLGELLARPLLSRIWRSNLGRLKQRAEAG